MTAETRKTIWSLVGLAAVLFVVYVVWKRLSQPKQQSQSGGVGGEAFYPPNYGSAPTGGNPLGDALNALAGKLGLGGGNGGSNPGLGSGSAFASWANARNPLGGTNIGQALSQFGGEGSDNLLGENVPVSQGGFGNVLNLDSTLTPADYTLPYEQPADTSTFNNWFSTFYQDLPGQSDAQYNPTGATQTDVTGDFSGANLASPDAFVTSNNDGSQYAETQSDTSLFQLDQPYSTDTSGDVSFNDSLGGGDGGGDGNFDYSTIIDTSGDGGGDSSGDGGDS